jgi:hypothetical protein
VFVADGTPNEWHDSGAALLLAVDLSLVGQGGHVGRLSLA